MSDRTLVVAPNWVGDNVMALPTLQALADSGRQLVLLAPDHLKPLLGLVPHVHEALSRGASDRDTVAAVRAAACSEAVILPNSFRSAWIAYRAGIPNRWGYRGHFRTPILSRPVRAAATRGRHQVEDYRDLLGAMGVPLPDTWIPTLQPGSETLALGRDRLERALGEPLKRPLVGIFPGAEFGPSKRWSWKSFAALGRELRRERPDARQVILAGPKEVWIAVKIHEDTARMLPVVGADLDLARLAGVMAHLDVLVTNDSGPMHLAAALGVPCVALFGPTDPARTAPSGRGHRVLYTDRWCSPCFRRRCPLIHHRCLRDIGVEAVRDAVLEGLGIRA